MDQMSRIAKDVQTGIMKTRMVPVGQVFSRFSRLVRDLAKEFGKNVKLDVRGEETELDKKVIDVLGEPLMHLIRNAIDHGIEPADERRRLSKPETATVQLVAFQSGNQILVQVSDDGRGLNAQKIRRKVLEKQLASPEALANMDDDDVYSYIYHPGFSTADVVSDISGRGVGMNVVKETVAELNGNVNIETEPGMGTRFILAFPLTLAIIPAIMVKVRRELFAIPLTDVIETIKISLTDLTTIEGHEVINLRGEILSLVRLNEFIGVDSIIEDGKKVPVVVVGFGNRKIGLVVDFLEGKQEIVIKSLEQNYQTVEGLAGASILGDGSICLILDIASMINKVILEQDRLSRIQRQKAQAVKKAEIEVVKDVGDYVKKTPEPKPQEPKPDKPAPVTKEEIPEKARPSAIKAAETKPVQPPVREPAPVEVKEDIIFEKDRGERFLPVEESGTAKALEAAEVDEKVQNVLQSFRDDLKDTIRAQTEGGPMEDHIKRQLGIDESDMERVRVLANMGITSAAESLSKIINKRVDLSIPEVSMMPVEKIPESVGEVDSTYIGVYMPLKGDIKGTILFSLQDESGFELIDMLFGIGGTKDLNEDGESALKEVTNIIGSSVINAFAEKTGIAIKPDVPTVVHDYMQSILDSILVLHNISNDYALVMDTQFYYQDDRVMGKLLVLPETESLKKLVEKLR
jgi:two-component system, chemotaxis family, sensor kinase CheA